MEKNKFGLVCGKWSNCFLQFRSLQLDSINSIEFVCIHQMSAVVLDTVKQRVVERFDSVVALDNGFLANWKTEDGSEAALKASLTERGHLRIDDTVLVQLGSDALLKVWNKADSPFMHGTWNMAKHNHTMDILMETVDTLIR